MYAHLGCAYYKSWTPTHLTLAVVEKINLLAVQSAEGKVRKDDRVRAKYIVYIVYIGHVRTPTLSTEFFYVYSLTPHPTTCMLG